MLTKQDKSALRSSLFRHLDGIATAPSAYTLYKHGVLEFILSEKTVDLDELARKFNANPGYLNVALRILASQGWLIHDVNNTTNQVTYTTNQNSSAAFELVPHYKDVVDLLKYSGQFHPRKFEREPFQMLHNIFQKFKTHYGLSPDQSPIESQVLQHIEGILIGPSAVALGMGGMFHKYFMEASFKAEEFHKDVESFEKLLDFFTYVGWFYKNNNTYSFTEKGLFFAKRASAYGVTVSYIPTFRMLDELIFGDPKILRNTKPNEPEKHVDREMNVWGSGGAHSTYFKKVDEVIISLFNQPIELQPKGIVDMGCGNGAYLEHLFSVIEKQTSRGEMLDEHPLFLVGADFNQAALKVTRANLIKADIWAKVIWGDIGRPDLLAADLRDNYNIDLGDLLNVRTFLDHNRIWESPTVVDENRTSNSTGAFAFRGNRISNNHVEDNLLEHLKKWSPFVQKFGLLVIELHSVDPTLAAANIGKTAVTAYDGTHGFSDQYIVEVPVFNKIAAEAGLYPDESFFTKYPNSDLATVSINLLKGK